MPKMKSIDTHPTKSWVVTADDKCRLCIWDYSSRCIQQTIYISELQASYYTKSSRRRSGSFHDAPGVEQSSSPSTASNASAHSKNDRDEHSKALKINEIRNVKWYDSLSIQIMTCSTKCERAITMLLILTDANIIIYDYVSRCMVGEVRPEDILSKLSFTSIECISETLIAIGCSDGVIRLWDTGTGHVVRELIAHSKSVNFLLCCHPIGLDVNQNNDDSRMRIVSVDSAGAIFVWDIAYTGNMIDGDSPLCSLSNTTSNNVVDITFDATNGILVILFDKQPCASVFDLKSHLKKNEGSNEARNNWSETPPGGKPGKRKSTAFTFSVSPQRKGTVAKHPKGGNSLALHDINPIYRIKDGRPYTQIIPNGHPSLPSLGVLACTKSSLLFALQWTKNGNTSNSSLHEGEGTAVRERATSSATPLTALTGPTSVFNAETDRETSSQQIFDLRSSRPALPAKLKIYSFRRHPLLPSILFAATNIGIFVLEMDAWRTVPSICRPVWPAPANISELLDFMKSHAPSADKHDLLRCLEQSHYNVTYALSMCKKKTDDRNPSLYVALLIEGTSLVMRKFQVIGKDKGVNKDGNAAIEIGPSCFLYDVCTPPSSSPYKGILCPPEIDVSYSGNFISLLWGDLNCYVILKLIRE
jgi:WD40 repeat protein